jgi:CBS-domain-containing membrane protein
MSARQVHRIPIVDDDGVCVGIISQKDLAHHLEDSDKLHATVRDISKSRRAHVG